MGCGGACRCRGGAFPVGQTCPPLTLQAETRLPVLLVDIAASERLAEKLSEFWAEHSRSRGEAAADTASLVEVDAASAAAAGGAGTLPTDVVAQVPWVPRFAVFAFDGDARALEAYVRAGTSIILTGLVCDPTEQGERLRALVPSVPLDALMLASNSPMHTPQTIPDHHIRSTRNEPSNLPAVLPVLVEAYNAGQPAGAAPWGDEHWAVYGARSAARLAGPPPVSLMPGAADSATLDASLAPYPPGRIDAPTLAWILYRNTAQFYQIPSPAIVVNAAGGIGTRVSGSSPASVSDAGAAAAVATADAGVEKAAAPALRGSVDSASPGTDASAVVPSAPAVSVVQFRCRVCRATLFSSADVKPHDSMHLQPSPASQAAAAAAAAAAGAVVAGKGAAKKADRASRHAGPAATTAAAAADEVAFSRWHEAKGKAVKHKDAGGPCRQLQVDQLPWMLPQSTGGGGAAAAERDTAGSLLCPGCGSKVGQYNLAGLKCSCGLFVCPAFKVPRDRVDEDLLAGGATGMDALEAALAAAELDGLEGDEDESDAEDVPGRVKKKRVKCVRNKGD